jgi:nucleotide-binding universal stress UspA family protein
MNDPAEGSVDDAEARRTQPCAGSWSVLEMSRIASPPTSKVLLSTDFSGSASKAAEVACAEARRRGARLYVLHVVRSSAEAATASARVAELAASFGVDVPATPITRVGHPAAEIVRCADEHDVDLIVVGGHGRTGITQALLGSVAERVARTSARPVLVVPQDRHDMARPMAPSEYRCVVCGNASEDLVCEPCRTNIRTLSTGERWADRLEGVVGDLAREQCEQLLGLEILGRFCCHAGGRLYVVPMTYAYDDGAVYFRSAEGTKVRMMRESPAVCLQVDHIQDMVSWRSVIAWGTFRELHGAEASDGWQKIMGRLFGWMSEVDGRPAPSFAQLDGSTDHRAFGLGRGAVVGRIEVTEMTGRYQQG